MSYQSTMRSFKDVKSIEEFIDSYVSRLNIPEISLSEQKFNRRINVSGGTAQFTYTSTPNIDAPRLAINARMIDDELAMMTDEMIEQNDSSVSYEKLPYPALRKIFGYLPLDDLCRAGRVCSKWYDLSRSPVFWRCVDTRGLKLSYYEVQKLLRCLPSCVTRLKIHYYYSSKTGMRPTVSLPELSASLLERCPDLKVLIFQNAHVSNEYYSYYYKPKFEIHGNVIFRRKNNGILKVERIDLKHELEYRVLACSTKEGDADFYALEHFPLNLRVLCLRNTLFYADDFISKFNDSSLPNIEVLDLTGCFTGRPALYLFSKLTNLKELHLSRCNISDYDIEPLRQIIPNLYILDLEYSDIGREAFSTLKRHGRSLKKLYVCDSLIQDTDLSFEDKDSFPLLEVICLRRTNVTHQGIGKLLRSCKSLKRVCVSYCEVPDDFYNHVAEKVRSDNTDNSCYHYLKFNYLRNY